MGIQSNKIFRSLKLLQHSFGQYKWQIAMMAALSFLSGLLEGISINAIIPLFSFIEGNVARDIISQTIEKFFLYFNFTYTIKYLLIFIVLLFIIKTIVLFVSQYITIRITADYEKKTGLALLKATLESTWPYLSKQQIGYLDQMVTTDVKSASNFLKRIGSTILIAVNLVVYGLIAMNISLMIALLALVLGGLIFLIFKPLFYKNRIASKEMAQKYKELAHYINENIVGMKGVKSMIVERQVLQKGFMYFDRMRNLRMRVGLLTNFTNVTLQPIGLFFIIGMFAFFYKTNTLNFASFAVIVYAINRIFTGVQSLQAEVHAMNSYVPYVMSILQYKMETSQHKEQDTGTKKFYFDNCIEFQDVSFSYNNHNTAISDVSFSIKKGEMIGLIGPSGAGKTTIVDLLLRLLDPQKGAILLDETNISHISLKEWRNSVSYVSQEIFLINDTIEKNIRFYNESIHDDDIVEAAKVANIYDFIQKQPKQFKTVVGERGIQLSGGERQRIVLARALARKPHILILDEATSALDSESEVLIQKSIEKLKGTITVIAIAHRLSTVVNSDTLIALENGKIIETGTPRELLKNKKSYFFKIYNLRQ